MARGVKLRLSGVMRWGLILLMTTCARVDSQAVDKLTGIRSVGKLVESPERIRHISTLKYSKVMNSLPVSHLSHKLTVAEDTDGDSSEYMDLMDGYGEDLAGVGESLAAGAPNISVSARCVNHTLLYIEALVERQPWAIAMIDSAGKLPSGVLLGNLIWRGAYDQCLNVTAVLNSTESTEPRHPFRGRYCRLTALLSGNPNATQPPAAAGVNGLFGGPLGLTIGVCVPDSCDGQDIVVLIKLGLYELPVNLPPLPLFGDCSEVQDISTDTRAIVVIVLASLFGAVLILGTGWDLLRYQIPLYLASLPSADGDGLINGYATLSQSSPDTQNIHTITENSALLGGGVDKAPEGRVSGKLERLMLAFSVYSNGKKLLATTKGQGTLGAVHGVRFLSMTWVMLGHTYVFGLAVGDNLGSFLPEMVSRFTFQGIANATVSVDSFFLLSGLLVGYLTLKEMDKRKGKLNWGLFYFHRFWRLTPPYMLLMMIYVPLFKYWGSGPTWPVNGVEPDYCETTWWTNLLYINNLVRVDKMCMGWSWYLANDMQFFVISPIILIPLYHSFLIGCVIITVLTTGSFLASGLLTNYYQTGAGLTAGANVNDYFLYIYIKPWCRVGPYLVGLLVGYVLFKTKCRVRLNPIVVVVGWVCAIIMCLSVVYGLYDTETHGIKVLSPDASALYNATSRTAWSIGLGWLIFACCTGYGGFVNTLLSWSALIPLSRLTYCAYLVHPIIMYLYYSSLATPLHFTDLNVIYLFFGHLVLSYLTAFALSLAFESPMMGLERVILKREKRS